MRGTEPRGSPQLDTRRRVEQTVGAAFQCVARAWGAHQAGDAGGRASRPALAAVARLRTGSRTVAMDGANPGGDPRRRLYATLSGTRLRTRRAVSASASVAAHPSYQVGRPGRGLGSLRGCDRAVTSCGRGSSDGMPCIAGHIPVADDALVLHRAYRNLCCSSWPSRHKQLCSTLFVRTSFVCWHCAWSTAPLRTLSQP